ncbi:HAD family hydrolase [uncultured Psychroserpens sp.]|uniref:HAD family hydrolase n=1 Tax=uncultured Psychroserpens sp. TaxID=255436 RepID=UPI0026061CDE|nr:HAD family hydrolase [uncultured Psychroserpens sp.]
MNISFDLDSTLIPCGNEFETEYRSVIAKLLGVEELRKGTKELIFQLQKRGHTIHIYTTSFRTKNKIRKTLKYYGIKVNTIINQKENQYVLRSKNIDASKYPKAFNFDLHIDDSKGVAIEAKKYNFETLIIKPSDKNWVETIKKNIKNLN